MQFIYKLTAISHIENSKKIRKDSQFQQGSDHGHSLTAGGRAGSMESSGVASYGALGHMPSPLDSASASL